MYKNSLSFSCINSFSNVITPINFVNIFTLDKNQSKEIIFNDSAFCYVNAGKISVSYKNQDVDLPNKNIVLKKNTLSIFEQNGKIEITALGDNCVVFVVSFAFLCYDLQTKKDIQNTPSASTLKNGLVKLFSVKSSSDEGKLIQKMMYLFSRKSIGFENKIMLLNSVLMLELATQNNDSSVVDDVTKYISKNYSQKITLESIAKSLYISPSYLSKRFSLEKGMSISAFVRNYRLQKAKSLLTDTELSVEKIALEVGFYDIQHFSKIFKREFGITPLNYRKEKQDKK